MLPLVAVTEKPASEFVIGPIAELQFVRACEASQNASLLFDGDASTAQLINCFIVLVAGCDRGRQTASRSPPILSRAGGFGHLAAVVVADRLRMAAGGFRCGCVAVVAVDCGSSAQRRRPKKPKTVQNQQIATYRMHDVNTDNMCSQEAAEESKNTV